MNKELIQWLDAATTGLPFEIQSATRNELESHYRDAVEAYEHTGETADAAHQQAMNELGDATTTAKALRKTHLSIQRHLFAFISMCLVFGWLVLNRGELSPEAWTSGSTRIVAGAIILVVFEAALWLLKDLTTRQLKLSFLKLPLNMQMIGWGLTIFPFLIEVVLAKMTAIASYLSNNLPATYTDLFQLDKIITSMASGLIGVGLLLMAWRLAKAKAEAHIYDFANPLKWISILSGLTFIYAALIRILNIFRVYFVVAEGYGTAQIAILVGDYAPEHIFPLSNGFNWVHGMSQFSRVCQMALLGITALIFFRAYWHNAYWFKQTMQKAE